MTYIVKLRSRGQVVGSISFEGAENTREAVKLALEYHPGCTAEVCRAPVDYCPDFIDSAMQRFNATEALA